MRPAWLQSGLVRLGSGLIAAGWAAVLGLAFVPVYLRLIGVEAYGLLGFYAALTTLLQVLDLGLSPTMNRELARYKVHPERAAEARDFVRTVEVGYWGLGAVLGLGLAALTPWLAREWLNPVALSVGDVQAALFGMAGLTFLQWPISLYQGGLLGLERQAPFNLAWVAFTTARHVGAWLTLTVWPSVVTYFLWQILVSAGYVGLLAFMLWRSLPGSGGISARVDFLKVRAVWRFALGMTTITITALILTQIEKVLLSNWLSLEAFGRYALAATVAGTVAMLVGPVTNVIFPRLSGLVAAGDSQGVSAYYHDSAQLMGVLVLPVAMTLIVFAEPLLFAWTQDAVTTGEAGPVVRLLAIGSALNAIMALPFNLQLAHGWTRLGVWVNIGLVLIFVPAIAFSAAAYGGLGASAMWIAINVVYFSVAAPLTHQRLLAGEFLKWLTHDVVPSVLACTVVGLIGWTWLRLDLFLWQQVAVIGGCWLTATLAAAATSPAARAWLTRRRTPNRL